MTKKDNDIEVPRRLTSEWWDHIRTLPKEEREAEISRAVDETIEADEKINQRSNNLTSAEFDDEIERIDRNCPDYPETMEEFYERVYIKNELREAIQRHDKAIARRAAPKLAKK